MRTDGQYKDLFGLICDFSDLYARRPSALGPLGPPWGPLFFIFYFPLLPAPLKPPGRTHTERLNAFRLEAPSCSMILLRFMRCAFLARVAQCVLAAAAFPFTLHLGRAADQHPRP